MVTVAGSNTSGRGLPRMGVLLVAVVGLLLGLLVAMSPAAGAGTSGTTTGPAEGSSSGFAATSTTGETAASDGNSSARGQQSEADAVAYINAQNTGTVTQVAAGYFHSCAVTTGNTVYCWGWNKSGQLGNDDTTQSEVPVKVVNSADGEFVNGQVRSVSAGNGHTCAVTTGNTVYCWGSNSYGQLGNDDGRYGIGKSWVPVAVSDNGAEGFANESVRSVSAGNDHTCAVTTGNTVYCWGNNNYGQLGNDSTTRSWEPVAVVNVDEGFSNGSVESVSAGNYHTCAVTTEGYAYCWGYNSYGQLGNNDTTQSEVPVAVADVDGGFVNGQVRSVSAGNDHTCAVTTGNTVYCWGENNYGQLGNGNTALSRVPVAVVDVDGGFVNGSVESVSAGTDHTCAVTTGNTVYCWGYNLFGQLGNGTKNNSPVPVKVVDENGFSSGSVESVSAGGYHTCAITTDSGDTVYCWGYNSYGQLGNDSTTHSEVPVRVAGQMRVVPSSVPFGTVAVGDTATEPVTVKHSFPLTDTPVVVTIAEKEGSREGFAFTPDSGCTNDRAASTLTLTEGTQCSGEVKFAPKAPGNYGGIVALIPQNYPNAGTEFAASGYSPPGADPDGPVAKADAVDFGKVDVYTAKVETVKVKNTGDEPLKITGGKITSDPDDEFAADLNDCTDGTVAAGKSCTAKVQFFPRQGGVSAALLELKSNAVGSATIALTGEGLLRVQEADEDGEPIPPGKVRKLTAPDKKLAAKKAQVKWKRPKGDVTITRYQTRMKKNGNWKKWSGKDPQPNLNGWISRGYKKLSPNTTYKVQVRAWSYDLKGPKDGVTFTTNRKGIPTKPGNG